MIRTATIENLTIYPSNIYFREMGAILAAHYDALLISDAVEIWKDEDGKVNVRKPSVDGRNFTRYVLEPKYNYIILMRNFDAASDFIAQSPVARIEEFEESNLECTNYLEVIEITEEVQGVHVKDAELIFAGGRGIMNRESFDALRRLAEKYGASVGASRPMVDQGWATWEEQIGQTGSIVRPKVYLAFGISGAVQHITGIEKSKNIIAVNLNEHAPIFRYANYGVYADDNSIIRNMLNILDEKSN